MRGWSLLWLDCQLAEHRMDGEHSHYALGSTDHSHYALVLSNTFIHFTL